MRKLLLILVGVGAIIGIYITLISEKLPETITEKRNDGNTENPGKTTHSQQGVQANLDQVKDQVQPLPARRPDHEGQVFAEQSNIKQIQSRRQKPKSNAAPDYPRQDITSQNTLMRASMVHATESQDHILSIENWSLKVPNCADIPECAERKDKVYSVFGIVVKTDLGKRNNKINKFKGQIRTGDAVQTPVVFLE